MVAYWPGVYGAATTLRWAVLWVTMPLIMMSCKGYSTNTRSLLNIAAFGLYAVASLTWTASQLDGILEIVVLGTLFQSIILGHSLGSKNLEPFRLIFFAASLGIGINSAIAIAQALGYRPVIQIFNSPSGLFLNGNILAETATLVAVGCAVHRMWMAVAIVSPAIVLPMHRGSIVAIAVVATWWAIGHRRWFAAAAIAAACVLVTAYLTLNRYVPTDAVGRAIGNGGQGIAERFGIWKPTLGGLTWFGHGAGAFRGLIELYSQGAVADPLHAHNDLLELTFNYGLAALIPMAVVAACLMSGSPYRLVVLALAVLGLSEFQLFMPATGFLGALCVGACLRDLSDRRRLDHGSGGRVHSGDATGKRSEAAESRGFLSDRSEVPA